MIFDIFPQHLLALSHKLFPGSIPAASILTLTDLKEETAFLDQWLHEKEKSQLAGYVYPKRRREWLAGRICAKQALRTFLQHSAKPSFTLEYNQCRVASEDSGRPYFGLLPGRTSPSPHLSITHSKSLAAALVSTTHCGIDIQYPGEGLQRVKERFCSEEEEQQLQQTLPHLPQLSRLALLWTGKEAIKKMLSPAGIPGFEEIKLCSITDTENTDTLLHFSIATMQGTSLPVIAGLLSNGYGMALCCLEHVIIPQKRRTNSHAGTP